MRILQVNKNHYYLGGAEKYYFDISRLLKSHGHEVAHFSMHNPGNIRSIWERYFVSPVNFNNLGKLAVIKNVPRIFYSLEAKRSFAKILDAFKPDVVHVHNIYYHISPSILSEARKRGIPVVYSVHDYHLLTPNVTFFHNGTICNLGVGTGLYRLLIHRCVRNSFGATLVLGLVLKFQRLLGLYEKYVDYFIAPSHFMRELLVSQGFGSKVVHIPYFLGDIPEVISHGVSDYVLYFGKVSEQKGVGIIFEVARLLPGIKFKIVGGGREKTFYEEKLRTLKLKNLEIIDFKGIRKEMNELISRSRICILPSIWYEVTGIAMLEAMAMAKPVIASRIGGIPEVINNGKNGLLFTPGDTNEFKQKIMLLWRNKKFAEKIGRQARADTINNYSPEIGYRRIMSLYKKVINKREK